MFTAAALRAVKLTAPQAKALVWLSHTSGDEHRRTQPLPSVRVTDRLVALGLAELPAGSYDRSWSANLTKAGRATLRALEGEAHPDDDAADLAAPAGPRVYLRGTVHLVIDVPEVGEASCGVSTRGGIDTEAPVSCPVCVAEHVEAGNDVDDLLEARREPASHFARVAGPFTTGPAVDEVLEARRQAEAPAPTLPGVDAGIVEAALTAAEAPTAAGPLARYEAAIAEHQHTHDAGTRAPRCTCGWPSARAARTSRRAVAQHIDAAWKRARKAYDAEAAGL